MKLRKTTSSAQIEHAVGKAVNYEVTIADLARRSERRAWWVAGASVLMSLILAGGYFYFLPLKEKVPYLVMADAYTGTATVARLRGDWNNNQITASEAINKSNVSHYILAREGYDLALLNLRDWATVFTMSESDVASAYRAENAANNPKSPYSVYGRTHVVRVKILSIQLIREQPDATPTGATARFQRTLYEKSSGQVTPLPTRFATLMFRYEPNLGLSEEDRLLNPLGYRVTSYRVENELVSAPPVESAAILPTAPLAQPTAVDPQTAPLGTAPASPAAMPPAAVAPPTAPSGTPQAAPATQAPNGAATR